jgi:hypothetical protein
MNDRNWEPRPWRGPGGFREERGRHRRMLKTVAGIGLVFLALILQVSVSTQVDMTGSRITRLQDRLQRVQTDLTVDSTRLCQGEIYSKLLAAAEQKGFGLARAYRDVKLVEPAPTVEPKGLTARLEAGLRLSPRLLQTEARAQEGRRRSASRP